MNVAKPHFYLQVDFYYTMVKIFVEVKDLDIKTVLDRVKNFGEANLQKNATISGLTQFEDNDYIKCQGTFIVDNFVFEELFATYSFVVIFFCKTS